MKELSSEARALIVAAAEGDGIPSERRERLERRLAASFAVSVGVAGVTQAATAASAPLAVTAAGASSAKVTLAAVAIWMAGGAAAGGASMLSASLLSRAAPSDAAPSVATSSSSSGQTTQSQGIADGSPSTVHEPKAEGEVSGRQRSEAPPMTKLVPSSKAQSRELTPPELVVGEAALAPSIDHLPDIAGETRSIETIRRELGAGRANQALQLLDLHERRFSGGALREEGLGLRVLALCELGRHGEARRIAEVFLREAPSSPLVPRLRQSCAFGTAREGRP